MKENLIAPKKWSDNQRRTFIDSAQVSCGMFDLGWIYSLNRRSNRKTCWTFYARPINPLSDKRGNAFGPSTKTANWLI